MAHIERILVLAVIGSSVLACDTREEAKVPSKAALVLAPAPVSTRAPLLADRQPEIVVAWVNDEPIHATLLQRHVDHVRGLSAQRERVLQRLIDQRLLDQHVQSQAVTISDAEVDETIDNSVSTVFGSREALLRHIDVRGKSFEEHRHEVRLELAQANLLPVPEADDGALQQLYREVANRPPLQTRVRLRSVLMVGKLGSAESVSSLPAFLALPGRHVELGWVDRDQMNERLAGAVLNVAPPGRSALMQTPGGTELYWVEERLEEPTPHFVEMTPMLKRRILEIGRAEARDELVRKLRASAEIRITDPSEEGATTR